MKSSERTITRNPYLPFLLPSVALIVVLAVLLLRFPKEELHLFLCQPHTRFLDGLVPVFSNLVDWLPYLSIVLLLFYRAGWSVFLAGNMLLTTMIVQPIKFIVNAERPTTWFAANWPDISLPLVDGVKMHHWLSFPSGHTTAFFALFFCLAVVCCAENIKGKYILSTFCFCCAAFGAYTRIYLSQHFALDILGGISIACMTTLILYFFYVKKTLNTNFWGWNLQKLKK
jgi:membrane-associated phospholipid phosphatase